MSSKNVSAKLPYIFRKEQVEVPESWEVKKYSEVLDLEYGNNLPKKDREDGQYPVYGSNGVTGWHNEYHVEPPSIVVGRKGTLEAKLSQKQCNVIDTAYYVNDDCIKYDKLNLMYLYHNLKAFDFEILESGSAVPSLSRDDFYNETVALPPIEDQKKIVHLLDTLDKKINVNNKIKDILENIVQSVFRSRFVDFEPYDNLKKSEVGEIPDSFEVLQIGDVCNTRGGGTPSTDNDEYWDGDNLWLTPKEVTSLDSKIVFDTERKVSDEGLNNSSTAIMPEKSVLLTSRATVGEVVVNREPMGTNQGFICIQPNSRVEPYYLACLVENKRPEIENRASGSTYDEISQTSFNGIQIMVPPKKDIEEFENRIEDIYEDIYTRELENRHLEELRDTLLPKLMSGEIRVDDIRLDDLEVETGV
ncbi:restriction endonuclease subunit S [Halorubrum trueperi]|uniref:Restriction endonuclease subunit S n=1 Tax=Halorubrum trueperi TaxID=2004704 RepID=A0ABD5UN07_9EURY